MSDLDEILSLRQQLKEARGTRNAMSVSEYQEGWNEGFRMGAKLPDSALKLARDSIIEECARVAEDKLNPHTWRYARPDEIAAAIRSLKDKP